MSTNQSRLWSLTHWSALDDDAALGSELSRSRGGVSKAPALSSAAAPLGGRILRPDELKIFCQDDDLYGRAPQPGALIGPHYMTECV